MIAQVQRDTIGEEDIFMAETLSGVNGAMIRWAREWYRETPEQVAQDIGVDLALYLRWESGEEHPTYAQLKAIGKVLRKPSAVFFFPEPPQIPNPAVDLGAVPRGLRKPVLQQFESARAYQLDLHALACSHTGLFTQRDRLPDNIPDLCRFLRHKLAVPIAEQKSMRDASAVFDVFRERLFALGVYVFMDTFQDSSAAGLCIDDDVYPVIVVNDVMSPARQNYTLFHELYHLIRNTSGVDFITDWYRLPEDGQAQKERQLERLCNAFSCAFLAPEDDLITELACSLPIREAHIAELAARYSVGGEVIAHQLYRMGRITRVQFSTYQEAFCGDPARRSVGSRTSGDEDDLSIKAAHLRRKYLREVFVQYTLRQIDSTAASQMLRCKVDQLDTLEDYAYQESSERPLS